MSRSDVEIGKGSTRREKFLSWVSPGLLTAKVPGQEEEPEVVAERRKKFILRRWFEWEFRLGQGQLWRKGLMKPVGIVYHPVKYFSKWKGKNLLGPPRFVHPWYQFMAVLGIVLGIGTIAVLQQYAFDDLRKFIIMGPFASSSVMVSIAPDLPLAQPRNIFGGHTLSIILGITVRKIMIGDNDITSPPFPPPKPAPPPPPPSKGDKNKDKAPKPPPPAKPKKVDDLTWLAVIIAVAGACIVMCFTKTLHPPAASTAMAGVLASSLQVHMGYELVLFVMLGSTILIIVALIVANLFTTARYPQWW